jgi:hypothetical protein
MPISFSESLLSRQLRSDSARGKLHNSGWSTRLASNRNGIVSQRQPVRVRLFFPNIVIIPISSDVAEKEFFWRAFESRVSDKLRVQLILLLISSSRMSKSHGTPHSKQSAFYRVLSSILCRIGCRASRGSLSSLQADYPIADRATGEICQKRPRELKILCMGGFQPGEKLCQLIEQ